MSAERITVEEVRADLPLDGFTVAAEWVEGPLGGGCRVVAEAPPAPAPAAPEPKAPPARPAGPPVLARRPGGPPDRGAGVPVGPAGRTGPGTGGDGRDGPQQTGVAPADRERA
ncbi:hypothetical protein AR457_30470 [Streptomyces agglomeratus]|nr:hypothetical protein BGK70_06175 [Streptomyces agglomeratus]OEJ47835.1 hypothetical protein AR457_30470 [Streptomyces agglomeratus]OEJ50317.1 hypothetical protein BGK72_05695 [Streptomyces agglomeratus]